MIIAITGVLGMTAKVLIMRTKRAAIHFVVPPAEAIGAGRCFAYGEDLRPICGMGHLLCGLGYKPEVSTHLVPFFDEIAKLLEEVAGHPPTEPWEFARNDRGAPKQRRRYLISWLRKNYPECEVKE